MPQRQPRPSHRLGAGFKPLDGAHAGRSIPENTDPPSNKVSICRTTDDDVDSGISRGSRVGRSSRFLNRRCSRSFYPILSRRETSSPKLWPKTHAVKKNADGSTSVEVGIGIASGLGVDQRYCVFRGGCGFSIRMSPRSTVSPGFTVNSLRSCGPGAAPAVDRSTM